MTPTWPQLCAITRRLYDPDQTLGEWANRTKERIAKDGFSPVLPHDLTRAMSAVERALSRQAARPPTTE